STLGRQKASESALRFMGSLVRRFGEAKEGVSATISPCHCSKTAPTVSTAAGGRRVRRSRKVEGARSIVLWFAAPSLFRPIGILYFGGPHARHTAPLVIFGCSCCAF